ncbi:MAG TPA: c-type cytochrome [Actinomycetota bacterium]|nr:c-type cytochrome [Actinomycetota bacterium]
MVALTQAQGIILAIGGAVLLAVAALYLGLRERPVRGADIPRAMRPGPSDADLETPLLERLQGWGVLLVAFFVVWVPLVWLRDPTANLAQERELRERSVERGRLSVLPFTEENQLGVGCTRCHGPELRGGLPVQIGVDEETGQPRVNLSANLQTVCQRRTVEEIRTTIEQGRPEAGMPSWSIRYQGALDDQQISDIVLYLVELSKEHVPFEQNKCLNPAAASPTATATPSPTA